MKIGVLAIAGALLLGPAAALAHVGNPDIYAEGQAGPYRLFVVIRPPLVIPGVADVEARAEAPGIREISITPVPLTGEASKHPPVPDAMQRPTSDAGFFTGHLWMMQTGSWQIRLAVSGANGSGVLSVPVPATALGTRTMTPALGGLLAALGALLVLGMIGIVGAAAREARLPPDAPVSPANRRHGYIAMSVALAVLTGAVVLGNAWWRSDALEYSGYIYKPLEMRPALVDGSVLSLTLHDPGWLRQRRLDDLIPDHDHLMHLYMIRWPGMDRVAHLHPEPAGPGEFRLPLPPLSAGTYRLYADVVHENGFPETVAGSITLPSAPGRPLAGDDAEATAAPAGTTPLGAEFRLPDGYRMVWGNPKGIEARTPEEFRFELLDPSGRAPADMALYMGMLGHAAFVKTDGSTFAHIHPAGTVSMAAFMMANPGQQSGTPGPMAGMPAMSMPGMSAGGSMLPNVVGFPYGFPSPGTYRIFVQMKHGSTVETGVFDATVSPSRSGIAAGS